MSIRLKLILYFTTASLAVVLIFASITYDSARTYAYQSELKHAHEGNGRLIEMVGTQAPSLEQIKRMIPHHEDQNSFYFIIEKNTGNAAYQPESVSKKIIIDQFIKQSIDINGENEGITSIENKNYFWATDSVPSTPYLLLNIYQHTERKLTEFVDSISLALAISIFIALWCSLWAATILANLYQRLTEQKTALEYEAHHDPLTSLPNRQSIGQIIKDAILANDDADNVMLVLVDIHGLKDINDSLGHECGDSLLRNVSERLNEILRTSDRVGRFGGDKFAVIITHSKNTATDELCNRLLSTFDRAFNIDEHNLFLGATLGIASYPDHAEDAQGLIQKAEVALHTAKDSSKDFFIYDTEHDHGSAKRLNLANDLRNAIRDGQLALHYQPQLDLRTGKIAGVEALARWIHPEHGFIPPDTFIDIAERTGLIKPLTEWVLATAIKQCAMWRKSHQSLTMSINLSARNLNDETLGKQVSRLIRHWQVIPKQICLEITETAMMADPEHAMHLLDELDRLGVTISIDDFGTGYSSLAYLKKMPVDEIKIDRSFVMNMKDDEDDASIIKATVSLAHDLGLSVVAEGVEDQESQDLLQSFGCEFAQGYHICRPAPPEDIDKLLAEARDYNIKENPKSTKFDSGLTEQTA